MATKKTAKTEKATDGKVVADTSSGLQKKDPKEVLAFKEGSHPMLGKRVIIRTYSAGVHIGTVDWVNPECSMEVKLTDSIRLWKWEGGGLSLSAIANEGMKGGRCNYTGEVMLTNAIEYIPVTESANKTYNKYIEV